MKKITHILCPTDFSETADKAVAYAEQLAIEADAQLTLVHAIETPEAWALAAQEHSRTLKLHSQLEAQLAASSHGQQIDRFQHPGEAGEVICWIAQDRNCDLIVMGTHGRTGLKHLLFGSVAEYVLCHARCPVVTIRDRSPDERPLERPVLMPVPAPRYM